MWLLNKQKMALCETLDQVDVEQTRKTQWPSKEKKKVRMLKGNNRKQLRWDGCSQINNKIDKNQKYLAGQSTAKAKK